MSTAKSLNQAHCLLLAIKNNQSLENSVLKLISKKNTDNVYSLNQLGQAAENCKQHLCIVLTNHSSWLSERSQEEKEVMKKARFFVVHINEYPFEAVGSFRNNIQHYIQIELFGKSKTEVLTELKSALRMTKKSVRHFMKSQMIAASKKSSKNPDFLALFYKLLKAKYGQQDLRTTTIAAAMGISQSTLERHCIKLTGKKPNLLISEFRLNRAYELCELTTMPFTQIAKICGFGSSSYFSVRFSEYFRTKPSHVRLRGNHRMAI